MEEERDHCEPRVFRWPNSSSNSRSARTPKTFGDKVAKLRGKMEKVTNFCVKSKYWQLEMKMKMAHSECLVEARNSSGDDGPEDEVQHQLSVDDYSDSRGWEKNHMMAIKRRFSGGQLESIKDRLQLWKINRMHKDGTWSSEDAMQRWAQACKLLAEEGLTPEDDNIEANERVFAIVMGPEHSGRVRTQGFGVTPTRFFPQSKTEGGSGSNFGQIASLREEFRSFQDNQKRELACFVMR
ncbi:hypothetical protein IEQ34_000257 [Dendrobium chrysotoxum]|uniref:Uncharacterized protein n=1 Tax=Dendrobium chrysotoxum TaxID=161865 RepID=A0AAV7H9S9_DENCH|nr:hypothetical protein IEQ34_000257 [Dendrobium chrysotoxum]